MTAVQFEKSPRVNAAIDYSLGLSEWISQRYPESIVDTGQRRVALALYSITLEHREAILLLLRHGARTSAFALARPVYEAFMTGLWTELIMTKEKYDQFLQRQSFPKIETMVSALSASNTGLIPFAEAKRMLWGSLSDFSHGGFGQVSRWIDGPNIAPVHSDEETLEILSFVDMYGLCACMQSRQMANLSIDEFVGKSAEIVSALQAAKK